MPDALKIWQNAVAGRLAGSDAVARTEISGLNFSGLPARKGSLLSVFGRKPQLANKLVNATLRKIDVQDSDLTGLILNTCEIRNCTFSHTLSSDWRCFGLSVRESEFSNVDFRNSVLAPGDDSKITYFEDVTFKRVDFRRTTFVNVGFQSCRFHSCKLDGVDFAGSTFSDVSFEGTLNQVIFNRHWPAQSRLPENSMCRVDFSAATLKSVEFRDLDLEDVLLPLSREHLIVQDYRTRLNLALEMLRSTESSDHQALAAYLAVYLKWAGRKQNRGVLYLPDLEKFGSISALQLILPILRGE